jgi:RNA recognition motif-containing protein
MNNPIKQGEKRLFIGGLQHSVKHEDLLSFLRKYGQVKELILPKKAGSNKCLGYGNFICDAATAERFINGMPLKFQKKKLSFKTFLSGQQLNSHLQDFNSKRVFIKNLPKGMKVKELKKNLKKVGKFSSVYIRSVSRYFDSVGVVMFQTEQKAKFFCKKLNSIEEGILGRLEASHQYFDDKSKEGTNNYKEIQQGNEMGSINRVHLDRDISADPRIFKIKKNTISKAPKPRGIKFHSNPGSYHQNMNQTRRAGNIRLDNTSNFYPYNEQYLQRINNTLRTNNGRNNVGRTYRHSAVYNFKEENLVAVPKTPGYRGFHIINQNHYRGNIRLNKKTTLSEEQAIIESDYGACLTLTGRKFSKSSYDWKNTAIYNRSFNN